MAQPAKTSWLEKLSTGALNAFLSLITAIGVTIFGFVIQGWRADNQNKETTTETQYKDINAQLVTINRILEVQNGKWERQNEIDTRQDLHNEKTDDKLEDLTTRVTRVETRLEKH